MTTNPNTNPIQIEMVNNGPALAGDIISVENDWHGRTEATIWKGPFMTNHNSTSDMVMVAMVFFTGCEDGDTVQWVDGNWKTIDSDDLYSILPW